MVQDGEHVKCSATLCTECGVRDVAVRCISDVANIRRDLTDVALCQQCEIMGRNARCQWCAA